jgi:hypothetical protein
MQVDDRQERGDRHELFVADVVARVGVVADAKAMAPSVWAAKRDRGR